MNTLQLSVKFLVMFNIISTKSSKMVRFRAKQRHLEKCYDDLGCVRLTPEWTHRSYRPVNMLPADRHAINTIFVYWRKHIKKPIPEIMGTASSSLYNFTDSMNILIHDFTSNGYTGWIQQLARILQSIESTAVTNVDNEVVSVDWAAGATPPYVQAIANARLVALEIVAFLAKYKNAGHLCSDCIHIYGHGVGAHIAGYVGKLFQIKHITALDPSGLYFTKMPANVKLDARDATFVEVIHTNTVTGGQGIGEKLGHVDLYPNGGFKQPGCNDKMIPIHILKRGDLPLGGTMPGCSHKRSVEYYIEALANPSCAFVGVSCPSYKHFIQGDCNHFASNPAMCFSVKLISPSQPMNFSNNLYFVTANSAPFCAEMLLVTLGLSTPDIKHSLSKGQYKITISQTSGNVVFGLNENSVIKNLNANERQEFMVFRTTPPSLEFPIQKIHLQWRPSAICFVKSVLQPLVVDSFKIKKVDDNTKRHCSQVFINRNESSVFMKPLEIGSFQYYED